MSISFPNIIKSKSNMPSTRKWFLKKIQTVYFFLCSFTYTLHYSAAVYMKYYRYLLHYSINHILHYLFVWGFRSHSRFFNHVETSALSALIDIAIEQGGLFNHTLGPVRPTKVPERLTVELSLPILTTYVCPDLKSNPYPLNARRTLYH